MAATVPNNPYDTQPAKATNTGIVGGAMTPAQMQQYNPTAALKIQSYTPTMSAVNKETETVGGQVNSILATDSPLMQRARALATQQMAKRGLVNTSMAQGAGVAAMTDKATEIGNTDAQIYSQRALSNQSAANEGGMFNTNQNNELFKFGQGIANEWGMQKDQQGFQTGEREAGQTFATGERLGGEKFAAGENTLTRENTNRNADRDRALTASEGSLTRGANLDNAERDRTFTARENTLSRDNTNMNSDRDRAFTSGENALSRTAAADTSQADRTFTANENQLNRAATATLNQNDQEFRGVQAQLDRDGQVALTTLTDRLNNAAVPRTFAANTSTATLNSITQIMADPNITPADKRGAIQNVIDVANATLQWGSTFYGTPLPSLSVPGGTSTMLYPNGILPASPHVPSSILPNVGTLPRAGNDSAPSSGSSQTDLDILARFRGR